MTSLHDRALLLRSLHVPGRPLVLPNAWDVASARLVEAAGAAAVATTSAGVAWSLGSADGDRLDRDAALALISRIAAAVSVPVTADIESGFARTPAELADTVQGVLDAGAVGINLEDSLRSGAQPLRRPAEQAARIAAARAAADAAGVPLFLNARIDTHRLHPTDPDSWFKETMDRARAYVEAGADGVFVLGTFDEATVSALADGVPGPLNLLTGPGALPVPTLAKLGVARISAGSAIAEAAYALVDRSARELLTSGTSTALADGLDYGTLNATMPGRPPTPPPA
ncbi:isocitrate lyase/phosphoenolpyruvate mutase family protein [Streptomyces sp. NBC_01433]|uniref:isocitrate lyase/PEP mutase family protein n=1 Tax=Streptomyces sp. NBC_01433 TaxID=2903864 RepID=UPI002251C3F2|nr:isocitrate lyase/phosphoenolpyruvate mutase family protein [Streptomyces sp. NBC_01433]MCX4678450.1 isocitrate lyase/phosphoenolpyruvate mutase family protein [Streptomyces sp. NBC_01433]